jgi:hypothetical protein
MSQTYKGLASFIFPLHIEHPDTTGRLDLLAYLGPVTSEGKLYGGYLGRHAVEDQEITGMVLQQVRDTCRKVIGPGKDAVVEEAVKKSYLAKRLSREDVDNLLRNVPILDSGCLDFSRLQRVVLALHHQRIVEIADQLSCKSLNAGVVENTVVYQHKPTIQYVRKKKKTPGSGLLGRIHSIVAIDESAKAESIRANMKLIRPVGRFGDKWDRSCAMRKSGKPDYVGKNGVRVMEDDENGVL